MVPKVRWTGPGVSATPNEMQKASKVSEGLVVISLSQVFTTDSKCTYN